MPVVDQRQAQFDLELLLSYLDHFCFFDRGHAENLRAWLSMYRRTRRMEPFTLNPGETHVWGAFTMTNMGTKRYVVGLEIREL